MPYVLPELPYDHAALEPALDARIVELHHDKHHAAYVKGANATVERLAEANDGDIGAAELNALEKNLAFHISGHALHSIFWQNMSPGGGELADGVLQSKIEDDFGSLANLQKRMTAVAMGIQGSGWAALGFDPVGDRLVVTQIYDHQANVPTANIPLLVLDMWEHAFYLQYLNVKASWVEAFWTIVNWKDVEERYVGAAPLGDTAKRAWGLFVDSLKDRD